MTEVTIPKVDDLLLLGLDIDVPAQVNRSKYTGRRQVVGLEGAETYFGSVAIDIIATELEERQWRAFLAKLKGPQNWFRWYLPRGQVIGRKPLVDVGATDGYSLPLKGMQPSTVILRGGQYMTIPLPSGHARAVCLEDDLIADGSGKAVAAFAPALHEVPASETEVETARPYIPMSPVDTRLGLQTNNGVSTASFDVEEAL